MLLCSVITQTDALGFLKQSQSVCSMILKLWLEQLNGFQFESQSKTPVIVKGKVWRCNSCRFFHNLKASRQLEANGQSRLIWERGVCCVGRHLPVIVKVKV